MTRAAVAVALLLALAACTSPAAPKAQRPHKELPPAPPPPAMVDDGVVCAADVKACADGSYVSRDPAAGCAFNACPGSDTK